MKVRRHTFCSIYRCFHLESNTFFFLSIYLFLTGQDKFLISHLLSRIRDCMTQLYAKDITPDDKQELDEALQREV